MDAQRLGGPWYWPGVGVLARPRRAFSMFIVRPKSSVALRALMAASASSTLSIVTNANPRDSLVCGSRMTWHFWICGRRGGGGRRVSDALGSAGKSETKRERAREGRTRPCLEKSSSRSRSSTRRLRPDTCRLLPGLSPPPGPRLSELRARFRASQPRGNAQEERGKRDAPAPVVATVVTAVVAAVVAAVLLVDAAHGRARARAGAVAAGRGRALRGAVVVELGARVGLRRLLLLPVWWRVEGAGVE